MDGRTELLPAMQKGRTLSCLSFHLDQLKGSEILGSVAYALWKLEEIDGEVAKTGLVDPHC